MRANSRPARLQSWGLGPITGVLVATILASCSALPERAPQISGAEAPVQQIDPQPDWRIAIHGGAGVITPDQITGEQEAAYEAALTEALAAGAEVLRRGGSSVDAVQAAVVQMENSELFNAGVGAVFTETGGHELDASIMSGKDRNAGSVAGVKGVKNPILAARQVMDASPHVMFAGGGADRFAVLNGLEMVPNSHFSTDRRRQALDRVLKSRAPTSADTSGTVGAVAIDQDGHLAAATSTGGMTAKVPGRVGDSPLIGAATYAQDDLCAVSATGHGEYFIRVAVAKTICARMDYLNEDGEAAAGDALDQVAGLGGDGGVIVMDGSGAVSFVFNTPGMYRGVMDPGTLDIAIYATSTED
ncbi:MAG: isoaspartyl peptidase/L-asparaginase [Pseudomonadota bacterium]